MTHNTLPFQRSNPLQTMSAVARAIALPHEYPATRFPSFPALERTATMSFNFPATITCGAGDTRALVLRQAYYPVWVEQTLNFWYVVDYASGATARTDAEVELSKEVPTGYGVVARAADTSTMAIQPTAASAVAYPVLGIDQDPAPWLYVPAGGKVSLIIYGITAIAADPVLNFMLEIWKGPGEYAIDGFTGMSIFGSTARQAFGTRTLTTNCWVRLKRLIADVPANLPNNVTYSICVSTATPTFTYTAINCGQLNIGNAPAFAMYPLATSPEYAITSLPWRGTRLTASAALFTNVTKALNKEGTVLCGRLVPRVHDLFNFNQTTLSGLHPAEKQFLSLETGAYTYAAPSTDLSDFVDYTAIVGSAVLPVYNLSSTALVNAMIFTDQDGGTSLAVNADWHIEFRTSSTLWPIGLSTMTIESFHQAQLALVANGFFFPNESHTGTISKIVRGIAGFFAHPNVRSLHPALGLTGGLSDMYLNRSNQSKSLPQSTLAVKVSPPRAVGKPKKVRVAVPARKAAKPKAKKGKKK